MFFSRYFSPFGFALILALVATENTQALKLELLAETTLPSKLKFEKTTVGGLSGIYFDAETSTLSAVSDDRGREGEPRYYDFKLTFADGKLLVVPQAVHLIKKNKAKPQLAAVLDMEGIAPLPWGNFLISSEGDLNHKPRVGPEILDVKKNGTLVRGFDLPSKFMPELTGTQTKGIRNNRGFEGLARTPPGLGPEKWFLMNEESLLQDSSDEGGPLRLLIYDSPEAWVIKAGKEHLYFPEKGTATPAARLTLAGRVSELLALSNDRLLVLERSMQIEPNQFSYVCKIFEAQIGEASDISAVESLKDKNLGQYKPIAKKLVLDFETLKEKLGGTIENFEGLAFGPEVNKKKTLIVISDDNFKKSERTQVLLFSVED